MDQSAVAKIVKECLVPMMKALGVGAWNVKVRMDSVDGGRAQCWANFKYESAHVTIDPAQHDDRDEVLDALRHELLHVVNGGISVLRDELDEDLKPLYHLAEERMVLATERMLDGLGWSPEKLVKKGKQS